MRGAFRRLLGWVTLAAFMGSIGLPLVSSRHLQWDDDVDCGSGMLAWRSPTPTIDVAHARATGGHCVFCHWQRAFAGAAPGQPVVLTVALADEGALGANVESGHSQLTSCDSPSRAPPSSPL